MIIPDERIIDTVHYYLAGAERDKGTYSAWSQLHAAEAVMSLVPVDHSLRQALDEEYMVIHNVLRDEERKEYDRNHDIDHKPKKSHGKGNRSAVRQMLSNIKIRI